jgi:hypothetical protein
MISINVLKNDLNAYEEANPMTLKPRIVYVVEFNIGIPVSMQA